MNNKAYSSNENPMTDPKHSEPARYCPCADPENCTEQVPGYTWIPVSERLPELPPDYERYFIVTIRRAHSGKSYVIPALYLNEKRLLVEDDKDVDEEGCRPFTGWYHESSDGEYDSNYRRLETNGDKVTHWMPLPASPPESQGEKG